MRRWQTWLWLLVVLMVPAQALASYSLRLPCSGHDGGAATAVEMRCHTGASGHASQSTSPADCCRDSCPDMTACALPPVASPPAMAFIVVSDTRPRISAESSLLIGDFVTSPFRPPAFSGA